MSKARNKLRANRLHCPYKVKLDLTNAQDYLFAAQKNPHYKNPEDLELYVCTACGWLHIGHQHNHKETRG